MDQIVEIIQTLNKEDHKEFKDFVNRFRKRSERKDLELFRLLEKNENVKRDYLLSVLYPEDKNIEAYHATRKRLLHQLIEFVHSKRRKEQSTSEGYIETLLSISEHLFEYRKDQAAWNMLKQAEELALKSESYSLLNHIFNIQIKHSQLENAPDLKEILIRKNQYHKLAIQDDHANTAYHLIRYELNQSLSTGKEINISKISKKVLREYGLTEIVTERPVLMYNIIAITRSAVLASKEFYNFEPYIIEKYLEIMKKGSFNKYNHYYKVNLLYMIAHVLYRNKKFKEAEHYLNLLYKSLLEFNKSHFIQFYSKYNLLLAAVYNYSGRNKQAIELLENLSTGSKVKLEKSELLNTYLNLSTYYFQRDEYSKSIRVFRNVQHSDAWLTKIMGFEWVLKKDIIECINQFELGNTEIVEQRLRSIEKKFGEYFQRELYRRVGTFLTLVKQLNENPSIAVTKDFYNLVETSFDFVGAYKEDIQAMTFYGWLKSKMQRKKYYQVLFELVNTK